MTYAKNRGWLLVTAMLVAVAAAQLAIPNAAAAVPLFYVQFGFALAIFIVMFFNRPPPSGPDAVLAMCGRAVQ